VKTPSVERSGAHALGAGQGLWERAKRVIPGGSMLFSKRPELWLPDLWPAYFSRAEGHRVWDLEGRELIDMLFAVGQSTLGYGHPEVDAAVRDVIAAGNMSSLNCPEEVGLAERLVELHPWADMVRFARTGGEGNAIAIRIARGATGKDAIAFCGYHGWHDWYLAANLGSDDSLRGYLLPGLEPNGVPSALRGTVRPFEYNDIAGLERILAAGDVGTICMEVSRSFGPANDFLQRVRRLATERGVVLLFDECTSGFRQTFGGLHKHYGVDPDIATFSKALGNGYAVTAVLGRREVMEAAQSSFISSTFWTERIGAAAGLRTLEVMERTRSWERITATGLSIMDRWKRLATAHGVAIQVSGLPALAALSFSGPNALAYKTLLAQEMLAKGYLASTMVYVSTAHTPEVVDGYFEALDPVFRTIRECEDGRDVASLLQGRVCETGFKRLA